MERIKKILTNTPEAFIYSMALTIVTMLPYIPNNFVIIVVAFFGTYLIYYGLNCVDDKMKNRMSVIGYLISFGLIVFGFSFEISETSFYTWLLTGYNFEAKFLPYIILIFIFCLIFFSISTFYFTYFYFRGYIMVFMLLIPIALYYKMVEVVPVIYIIFVTLALFMIYIFQIYKRNILTDENKKVKNNRIGDVKKISFNLQTRIFVISLAVFLGIITVIIPKSDVAEYRNLFDEFISRNPFSNRNLSTISNVTDESTAENYPYLSRTRILFYGIANEPLYLRRSAFGKYDGEKFIKVDKSYISDMDSRNSMNNMEKVYEYMTLLYDLYPEIFEKYDIKKEDIPDIKEVLMSVELQSYRFYANYFLNTVRVVEVDPYDLYGTLRMDNYGCITVKGIDSIKNPYTIYYYSDIARNEKSIMDFAKKFSGDEYKEFIETLKDKTYEQEFLIKSLENTLYKQTQYYLEVVYSDLNNDVSKYNEDYSDRIKELALSITKDCENDIERAEAIESYFHTNGYEYSNSYEPEDKSIEYFIFESKKGACKEYATATTLMLHSLGINARYTEGFVMHSKYPDGKYYITAGNSHAYVEVYIPLYGYTVFEPTKFADEEEAAGIISGAINRFGDIVEISKGTVIYFVILGIVIVILYIIFRLLFLEKTICLYISKKCIKANNGIVCLYNYIQRMAEKSEGADVYALTPQELSLLLKEKFDVDIKEITDMLTSVVYEEKDIEVCVDWYKSIYIVRQKYNQSIKEKNKKKEINW